ncbi:replication factor C subunit 1-like [Paramacrobiotus metropolitanus]|uniref:replication factor C subunit 1-like n=1 Tax=Paramacrobiotus metropolitanus TaxID=2943436 RepID=UPI0024460812|nr:replication factor C subunit 1-like [Paramacrobiotus metropolitanus]
MSKPVKNVGGSNGKRSATASKGSPKKTKKDEDEDGDGQQKKNAGYRKFMSRAPPQALGSKEVPEGPEDCLQGLDFVVTGVLDSITREDAEDLIKRHGGSVKTGVSKKTSYLVAGRDAGESKLKKAKEMKTKIIDEDGLFDLVRKAVPESKGKPNGTASGMKATGFSRTASVVKVSPGKSKKKDADVILLDSDDDDQPPAKKARTTASPVKSSMKAVASSSTGASKSASVVKPAVKPASPVKKPILSGAASSPVSVKATEKAPVVPSTSKQVSNTASDPAPRPSSQNVPALLWVDKYQPKSLKNVVGQHTPQSPANKLLTWLQHWQDNRKKHGFKAASAGLYNKSGSTDGASFKAVLLSGPPGIGKTTTAVLACKEAGFTYVHVNASDNRSKRILQEQFMSGVTSHSLLEYQEGAAVKSAIIMDEVDGMAGNEDRGGVQEVIQLIKNCKIPVICICNDRQSQKMRSLAGYCYDLRFQRPRLEPIRGAMLSICAKEGINIKPNALDVIIEMSRHDIRQVLHNLYTWTSSKKTMTYDEAKANAASSEKDSIKMGAFEACRLMFAAPKGSRPGDFINEKMDLYFEDYNFVPLFIFENYLQVHPYANVNKYEVLDNLSKAAESFSISDMIDAEVRSKQSWHLLPQHAVFSAVIPGNLMRGAMGGMINFPQWLGKNSSSNKNKRLAQELQTHMRLRVSSSFTGLVLDYLPVMRKALTVPLKKDGAEGVDKVADFVNAYDMLREDIDSVLEVTSWGGKDDDPMKDVPASVKSTLTRQLNKGTHLNPYSSAEVKKSSRARAGGDAETDLLDEETAAALTTAADDEDKEDDNVEKDTMIKVKAKTSSAAKSSSAKGGAGRGGRGGGRGAGGVTGTSRRGKK